VKLKYICASCGNAKKPDEFYPDFRYKDQRSPRCLDCYREANRKWGKEHRTLSRIRALRSTGVNRYDEILAEQLGVCAICGLPPNGRRLAVDHDHETGEIRGLLCAQCNFGLGNFGDDPLRLHAAISYVEKYRNQ
jgi:hypothetical protein